MNFVAQVEDHLRDLGAEARKTHPGVKEASERAILHLRSLQTQYVAAVRRAGASKSPTSKSQVDINNNEATITAHPTTSLFQSHDVLRPFLLTLNHPDISHTLSNGAMEAIQLLLRGDAVISSDGVYIAQGLGRLAKECRNSSLSSSSSYGSGFSGGAGAMALGLFRGTTAEHRVLTLNQRAAKEEESMAFKILQTMTMLVDARSVELTKDVLGHVLLGILVLGSAGVEYEEQYHPQGSTAEGSGGNVRRAALATMNQVLSILFERGRDVMLGDADVTSSNAVGMDHDESLVLNVAQQTLVDLCDLVHNNAQLEKRQIVGPFAAAVKEKMGPTPTMCLSLIDMIFKQRGIDFFRVCQRHFDSPTQVEHLQFALDSIQQTSQLVLSTLQTQQSKSYTSTTVYGETSDSVSFCLFYYATSLGCTILTNYLTPRSLDFYQKMDSMHLANENNATAQIMSCNALKMIQLLVGYVSAATDAYHNSEFEDGYMFNQTEREALNIGKDEDVMSAADEVAKNRKSTAQTGATQATPDPLVSNDQLWRAFLSLEVIYSLMCSHLEQMALLDSCAKGSNSDSSDNESNDKECQTVISAITKAASDLATISGSNRERILHVVLIAHDDTSAIGEPSKAAASLAEKFSDSQIGRSAEVPICDTGLATWLSFKCVLALLESLKVSVSANKTSDTLQSQQSNNARQILKESFAPSVSVLQHFIKRMSGSHVVVSQTLSAYENLAYSSMVLDSIENNLRRHAIITSLCKLCLPSWGKNRANSQLKESNIDSLWVLLRIVHEQFNNIYEEWHTILSTLDQLAVLSIKSSKLPANYYTKASNIGESLARLPKFTTCFSNEALSYFVASLVSLSKLVSLSPLVEQATDLSRQNSESFDYGDGDIANGRESISGKLISFAGRSLGFGGGSAHATAPSPALRRAQSVDSAAPQFSKVYSDDLREASCMLMMAMKISTPRSTIRKLPLPLLLLCVVVEANSYRFKVMEEALALHLCDIVSNSTAPEYRSFAMEILIHFIPLSLSKSPESAPGQPISAPTQSNKPLDVIPFQREHNDIKDSPPIISEVNLLQILCDTIRQSRPETAEAGLSALHTVLEGASHDLSGDSLVGVIGTLSVLSGFSPPEDQDIDRSDKSWANVSTKSFQIFKLIFDDFLEPDEDEPIEMPSESTKEREAIVNCCVSFGKSRHDVNTSLTATGMLWTLADQDPTPGTLNLVLSKLSYLALDNRPELRNCAVNTLVSCAVGRGHQFTNEQWEKVLNQTIFGIMKDIETAINGSENQAAKGNDNGNQRYKVAVHHSRDSVTKQWSTTLVLTLRGLERILRLFFPRLLGTTSSDTENPWFLFTWTEILRFSLESATLSGGRETLDIRLAGIELITLCAQLACKSGMVASANTARVGTNMEVIGGALRSVRAATVQDEREVITEAIPLEPGVEAWRIHLFDLAFSSLVVDFQEHLSSSHAADEATEHYMIDSVSTQVLNKLASELAKLYECCKNDEIQPGSCELRLDIFSEDDGSNESRFINLLLSMVEKCPSESSRFLNQVQRGVMTLLQSMASNSSLRAFKALTSLSGDRMFVRSKALSTHSDKEKTDDGDEVFELEAARTISNAFRSDDMVDEVRVVVMCSVLLQYLNAEKTTIRAAAEARYDFFISVIDSGVEAVSNLDIKYNAGSEVLDAIWDRILAAVTSILLPPPLNRHDAYVYHSKSFLNIVALVLLHMPKRKYARAELMLERGAHRAVEVAFECNVESAAYDPKVVDGAVEVFLACFMGLCQNIPASHVIQTLTNQILGEIEPTSSSATSPLSMKTQQKLALAVLESLKASSSNDLLIGLFPMLCRLTNVENDGLRKAAGAILGGVNISEAILRERRRAEESETRAREIEEENNALLEEVEFLQAENEELQRQLAVFSESSDFT